MHWHTEATRHTVHGLIGELYAPDVDRRLVAAEALSRMGQQASDAVKHLARMLQDVDASARKMAALALGRIGGPSVQVLPELVSALEDPHSGVRHRVFVALTEILHSAPHARGWLYHVQGNVAGEAAYLLADLLAVRQAA